MITIIFAPPGTGKTALMTHFLNEFFYDKERTKAMQEELQEKNNNGWNLSIPVHPVSANYDILSYKLGFSRMKNRIINPYRLGFKNEFVKTHFNLPYEVIGIDEAQKYLNSRMSVYFPDWQSRFYEQHRHNNIDIYLATQRPMLIDINIRELASFIEVKEMKIKKHDMYGNPSNIVWKIRHFANSRLFDRYMSSGEKDTDTYEEETITAEYNVFACYNSQSCKPKFYDGYFDSDFDYMPSIEYEETAESYKAYLKNNDDELPQGYYQKKKLV